MQLISLSANGVLGVARRAGADAGGSGGGRDGLPERPIKKSGFRLLARASGSIKVNQVQCGLISNGQICVDSTGSSTIPGSVWPKGTNNQYTFNSGISLAGIVGRRNAGVGGRHHRRLLLRGQRLPAQRRAGGADLQRQRRGRPAQWPEFAKVPGVGDSVSAIYDPLLQGQISASQGDVYFLTWDGNPARVSGRIHPMGVVVETRGLAWNYPAGNQDIIYFIYTLYNVSSVRSCGLRQRPARRCATGCCSRPRRSRPPTRRPSGWTFPDGGYTPERACSWTSRPTRT